MTNLSDRTFRNPSFIPLGSKDAGSVRDHLYEVEALLRTALCAFQNDTTGAPMSARGIDSTLEVALHLLGDLGPEIEDLQLKASATEAH
ncbi:hypothetical protein C8D95_104231 [Silicimonas algicola]|uniref:Uncharacterized protein n=1 Tax=Silicimonas algicola TaxID=1826607 RepID=A0A316G6X3_9RHOB|nr:hypothetical protein C8D95_104231 [Silicimonas algicola]